MKSKKSITKKATTIKTKTIKKSSEIATRASLGRQVKRKQTCDFPEEDLDDINSEGKTDSEEEPEEESEEEQEEEDTIPMETDNKEGGWKKDDIVKVLSYVFPLNFEQEDLEIDDNIVNDVKSSNGRECSFTAKYKQVDVLCVRIIVYGDVAFHQEQYYYAYDMSQRLIACRNMANYHAIFQCNKLEKLHFIKNLPKKPYLLLVKPLYNNGTLQHYLGQLRKSNVDHVPHEHMLQMAINLFSMLTDAHTQNIGLVNINADTLFVGDDRGLYFDGFDACILLNDSETAHSKFWMNLNALKCPESYKVKNLKYLPSTDVYFATVVLIELAKDFKFTQKPYIVDKGKREVTLKKQAVHKDHSIMVDIIERGLKFTPSDRATASEILELLEGARAKYLSEDSF